MVASILVGTITLVFQARAILSALSIMVTILKWVSLLLLQ